MKIKDLPHMERPYEKLELLGSAVLSNAELLAIILKTGAKNITSIDLAQRILKLDVEEKGLSFLKSVSTEELMQIEGLGRVKCIQLKALGELFSRVRVPKITKDIILSTPEAVADLFIGEFNCEEQEYIKTLILNTQNKLIRIVTNAKGSTNASYVELKSIFKEPIKLGAAKIIVVHNHPSGDPTPSKSDINFTIKVRDMAEVLGIEFLDHVIIGENRFVSLKRMKKF